jgi:hypothetical protein
VLLTPRPAPKLEDHALLSIRDCLFNIFATCCGDRAVHCTTSKLLGVEPRVKLSRLPLS